METLAGKTAKRISAYFESIGEYKDEQPHALCTSYFESVASREDVKIKLLKSILKRLEELAGKEYVRASSSTVEDLLINALLQDFGFIEEFEVMGGVKLRITEMGLYNMEDIKEYIKEYNDKNRRKRIDRK